MMLALYYEVTTHSAIYRASLLLLTEISTPFMNIRLLSLCVILFLSFSFLFPLSLSLSLFLSLFTFSEQVHQSTQTTNRWLLHQLKMEGTKLYAGSVLAVLFAFMIRVLLCILLSTFTAQSLMEYHHHMNWLQLCLETFVAFFFLFLNTYWFIIIATKIVQAVMAGPKPKPKPQTTEGKSRKCEWEWRFLGYSYYLINRFIFIFVSEQPQLYSEELCCEHFCFLSLLCCNNNNKQIKQIWTWFM